MKSKARYIDVPTAVQFCPAGNGFISVFIAINPVQCTEESHDGEPRVYYLCDSNEFIIPAADLNKEAIISDPEAWLDYVPALKKEEAKATAQRMVDELRNGCPVVPVPSYRADAAVCHRPADDVKMLGGYMMGGLPYFELASGEVVSLTADDLAGIMRDVTQWEVAVQQAKQAAWAAIDAATTQDEINAALAALDAALH